MSRKFQLTLDEQGLPKRMHWRPVVSPLGLIFGIVFDAGVEILAVQASIDALSWWTVVRAIAFGIMVGIVVPSTGAAFGVRMLNRRIDELRDDAEQQQKVRPALATAMVLVLGLLMFVPATAGAVGGEADCTLIVNGRDITDRPTTKNDPIVIQYGDPIAFHSECDERIYELEISALLLGFKVGTRTWVEPDGSPTISNGTQPNDWEKASTGLWRAKAVGYDEAGREIANADYWLRVEGKSLITAPAGISGLAAAVVGATGLLWLLGATLAQALDVAAEIKAFRNKLGLRHLV